MSRKLSEASEKMYIEWRIWFRKLTKEIKEFKLLREKGGTNTVSYAMAVQP